MNPLGLAILASAMGLFLAACSSTPVSAPTPPPAAAMPPPTAAPAPAPAAPAPARSAAAQSPGTPVPAANVATANLPAHLDPSNPLLKERSVYFDFDDSALRSEFASLIERHGRYLASKPSLAIKIEGNTDERGSAEYNLALGQRRAEAVLRALKIYGVRDAQMEAISWGEERPRATGHQDAAWTQNRRADLAYPRQ